MKTITRNIVAFAIVLAGFATTATSASADTYHHIDELANHIARQSRLLVSEVRHYRHTPEYRHLVDDANDMYRFADHLHDVAHNHGSISHMESDVRKLDSKFHHLESVFNRAERSVSRGCGYVRGNTGHVRELLHNIEDDIHHLRDDLRELRRSPHRHAHTSYRIPTPTIQPPRIPVPNIPVPNPYSNPFNSFRPSNQFGHGYSHHRSSFGGRTLSIGGGSSRLTFSF